MNQSLQSVANLSDEFLMCLFCDAITGYTERHALPEPKRASEKHEAKKSSLGVLRLFNISSMKHKHKANALIDDAEEAIPEEWK
ncbi:MAG: hypothetical protein U0T32_01295 [Chitinophagales bacterium]